MIILLHIPYLIGVGSTTRLLGSYIIEMYIPWYSILYTIHLNVGMYVINANYNLPVNVTVTK